MKAGFGPRARLLPLLISYLKDRRVMAKIVTTKNADMKRFGSFAGYPVAELLRTALRSLADCDREDAAFLRRLARVRPTELPLADLKWLVGICRHVAGKPLPRLNPYVYQNVETFGRPRLAILSAS